MRQTADHAARIAENVCHLKKKIDPEIVELLEKMSDTAIAMFEAAVESLFRQDYSVAETIVEKTKVVIKMEKESIASAQNMDIEEAPYVRLIIESIRRIAEYASDIAEIVLNLTVESILS